MKIGIGAILRLWIRQMKKQNELVERQNQLLQIVTLQLGAIEEVPEHVEEEATYDIQDDEKEGLAEIQQEINDYGWDAVSSSKGLG